MVQEESIIKAIIEGRRESYVKKSPSYNPYTKSVLYDWEFKLELDDLIFTDSYRGINPYSGVEYVYEKGNGIPVWACDYVGYVNKNSNISTDEIYKFLKEARGNHLNNCAINCNNLFTNYIYSNGDFKYETFFQGDMKSLLQMENIYFKGLLVAQQITAGRLRLQNNII